jgi:hypothetical protein
MHKFFLSLLVCSCFLSAGAQAQQSEQNLAKELTNPIASLISVPVQINYDRGIGPLDEGTRVTANIQPVVPFELNANWTLISRTIVPIIRQNDIFPATPAPDQSTIQAGQFSLNIDETTLIPGAGTQFGLGDVVQSFFFSPRPVPLSAGASFIFGAGPVLLLPVGTDDLLTTDKWGAGPTAVGLVQAGPWTVGALANHIWSFAGNSQRDDISASFVQPFLSFTTPDAYTFSVNTEATYDWEGGGWSVPVNFVVSKLTTIGNQPVSFAVGARYWAETPDGGADGWGARFTTTFLFPASQ